MLIERLSGGPWGQNTFLITNGSQAMLVDPGGGARNILNLLADRKLSLVAILNTHGHFDHIGAVQELIENTDANIFISVLKKCRL